MDQPVIRTNWLNRLIHGDLDTPIFQSAGGGQDYEMLQATLKLSILSMILSWSSPFPGNHSRRQEQYDHRRFLPSGLYCSIPNFWQAFIFIMIFIYLDWLPVADTAMGDLMHMILPATVLRTSSAAVTTRLMRSSLLEAMNQDISSPGQRPSGEGGDRKACPEKYIDPVVTMLALSFGFKRLSGDRVDIRLACRRAGCGFHIYKRDYTMIQGSVLLLLLYS